MYTSEKLQSYSGIQQLYVKAQSENPSGFFKDNGMTVAVSHGRSLGFSRFACSSTGNTSSSLAMYAALADGESYVYVPQDRISQNKVLQTLAYGANVIRFDGTYDDGIRFLCDHAEELGLYVCNSVNPMRIEGQKSIIYEIAHTLEWKLPSWKKALRMIEATNGVTIAVSDEEILDAKAMVDQSGIGCEPASAATIAGLRALIETNVIDKEESALCILAGNMLKDTDALYQYHLGESPGRFQRTIQNSSLHSSAT